MNPWPQTQSATHSTHQISRDLDPNTVIHWQNSHQALLNDVDYGVARNTGPQPVTAGDAEKQESLASGEVGGCWLLGQALGIERRRVIA